MDRTYVNIHTHRPTGRHIELRTAGVHPWDAGQRSACTLPPFDGGVQAVGEIGLDYACDVPREAQLTLFREQLRMAREQGLPVVLHCVRAFEATMRELAACPPRAAIFHGFVGSPEQARQALGRGHFLSFGERTFASPRTLAALRATPLDRLFVETDESDTPIETLYARIAAARGTDTETLRRTVRANYERLFGTLHG